MDGTVSDQLVIEYAAGAKTSSFEFTDEQMALKISPYLLFLAAVVFAEEELYHQKQRSTSGRIRNERFDFLQKLYHKNALPVNLSPIIFMLSPRLQPSPSLLEIVKRDLITIFEKLEYQAKEAEKALLDEDSLSSSNTSSFSSLENRRNNQQQINSKANDQRKNKRPKSKSHLNNKTQKKVSVTKTPENKKTKNSPTKSIEVLIEEFTTSSIPDTANNKTDEEINWIKISKKNRKTMTTENLPARSSPPSFNPMCEEVVKSSLIEEAQAPIMIGAESLNTLSSKASSITDISHAKDFTLPLSSSAEDNESKIIMNNGDALMKENHRIAIIEQKGIALDQKLAEERIAHTKQSRMDKERYEDIIQALQLRLYISETKLKTYEDALQKHIEVVSTLSCSSSTQSTKEELLSGSPSLLSKVIDKNMNKITNKSGR